jgi:hypothetical protein
LSKLKGENIMPQIQLDFFITLIKASNEIAEQLKIANKLKAIEIKAEYSKYNSSIFNNVDNVMENCNED